MVPNHTKKSELSVVQKCNNAMREKVGGTFINWLIKGEFQERRPNKKTIDMAKSQILLIINTY